MTRNSQIFPIHVALNMWSKETKQISFVIKQFCTTLCPFEEESRKHLFWVLSIELFFVPLSLDCQSLFFLLGQWINIASHLTSDLLTPDCWDSDDSPPPLPERTPESFILATGASLHWSRFTGVCFQWHGFTDWATSRITSVFYGSILLVSS